MLTYDAIANAFQDAGASAPVEALLAANHLTLDDLSKADYQLAALLAAAAVAHANAQRDVGSKQRGIYRERLHDAMHDIKVYLQKN